MQTIQRNTNERGSAILMVLGILALIMVLAMVFAVTSRNSQAMADANADQVKANLVAQSAATQATEVISLFQNKGNILKYDALEDNIPLEDTADIDQSPSTEDHSVSPHAPDLYFYGESGATTGDMTDGFLGLQPYVAYFDATTECKTRALYGELSSDAHASTPFGIANAASDVRDVKPYQSLYYSHEKDDYDEENKEGDNSLYQIIANTRLGKFYHDATEEGTGNQFEALLKNDVAKQLQFKNVLDADGHIVSRMGFLAFAEGSKFDVNQLVKPKMPGATNDDMYVPFVDEGAIAVGDPGNGVEQEEIGVSTYAIMGYKYDSDNRIDEVKDSGVFDETETLQYGLHPQELQTRIVTNESVYQKYLKRADKNEPPRWFTYDMLTEHTVDDVKDAFKKDIFTLGIASGADDREMRFNGQYKDMDELLDNLQKVDSGDVQGNFLQKVDIAHPWGVYCDTDFNHSDDGCSGNVTWEKISESMAEQTAENDFKNRAEYYFKKHLGLNYKAGTGADSHSLFVDNAGEDVTPQVFANMVDFCDEDYAVTYWAEDGSSNKLKFNTADYGTQLLPAGSPVVLSVSNIPEPIYCGNERVPVVVGANVTFNGGSNVRIMNGGNVNGGMMNVSMGTIEFTPVVNLSLQNFFNEELKRANQNYRVILKGKITPFILGKYMHVERDTLGNPLNPECWNVVVFHNGMTFNDWVKVGMPDETTLNNFVNNHTRGDYGMGPSGEMMDNLSTKGMPFSYDTGSCTVNRSQFDSLENQTVTLTGNLPLRVQVANATLGDGSVENFFGTGTGYAVQIEKIIVMVQNAEDTEDGAIAELAYAQTEEPYTSVVYGTMFNEGWAPAIGYFGSPIQNLTTVNGVTCKDPRLNHKSDQWTWLTGNPEYDDSDSFFGISAGYYKNIDSVTGGVSAGSAVCYGQHCLPKMNATTAETDWSRDKFAGVSMATVKKALKNDDPDAKKDWEPDFEPGNMAATMETDYASSKMDTTLSTYFIPNYPFTSLWQLGAIHRGVEGQTINLKKFGMNDSGEITHKFEDGDAWMLDYFCLNEIYEDRGVRGKFNPNCFNAPAYRFLFANIPANTDAKDTMIYANGFLSASDVDYNEYYKEFIDDGAASAAIDLEDDVFRFKTTVKASGDYDDITKVFQAQSWSPVQAFFNFVDVDGGGESAVACNDRQAESLIGCTAGLLSTRYEIYTVIAVGQSVKFLMSESDMPAAGAARDAYLKQLMNPIQLNDNNWYSILATQVRQVTLLRDCWFGKITVLKSQVL